MLTAHQVRLADLLDDGPEELAGHIVPEQPLAVIRELVASNVGSTMSMSRNQLLIARLMGPGAGVFASLIGPPDRQGHGATRPGWLTRFRQGHGASRSPGSWGHPTRRSADSVWTTESKARCLSTTVRGRRREAPMSFRELNMIDVREVLRRWKARQSA